MEKNKQYFRAASQISQTLTKSRVSVVLPHQISCQPATGYTANAPTN